MLGRLIVAGAVVCLLSVGVSAQAPTQWRVRQQLTQGPTNHCSSVRDLWVREDGGLFRLFDGENRHEAWAMPMAADGSIAEVEVLNKLNRHILRVTVPAGRGPRKFLILDTRDACRWEHLPH